MSHSNISASRRRNRSKAYLPQDDHHKEVEGNAEEVHDRGACAFLHVCRVQRREVSDTRLHQCWEVDWAMGEGEAYGDVRSPERAEAGEVETAADLKRQESQQEHVLVLKFERKGWSAPH